MSPWTIEQAESHVLSLEQFGMRLGLDRMRRLLERLGDPQKRLRCVHVVGSNGKTSTTRMTQAILDAHDLRTGAYVSPHLVSFTERIVIDGAPVASTAFAAAIERTARAAEQIERDAAEDDRVTQFELLTAAALDEFARCEVDVVALEAGLGGRLDATNVVDAAVVALTSVSLEHTEWLGETLTAITAEKLAVLPLGGVLVTGILDQEAMRECERVVSERAGRLVRADLGTWRDAGAALPGYLQANFAVAAAAAEAILFTLDAERVGEAARVVSVPGRLQVVGTGPLTLLDGAHNPEGIRALCEHLNSLGAKGKRVVVCSILDDKDATTMLQLLSEAADVLVLTEVANPRALPVAALARMAPAGAAVEKVRAPAAAFERARGIAGVSGTVVVTGSTYLVGQLLKADGDAPVSVP